MKKKNSLKLLLVVGVTFFMSAVAFANDAAAADAGKGPYAALAACLGIAIAAFGGSLGQSKAATAALEGIARNPAAAGKLLAPMIVSLALIESLVIYAFIVCLKY